MRQPPEKFSKKLLVEGVDDFKVTGYLLSERARAPFFDIIDCGGKTGVTDEFPLRIKQSGVESIGVVLDMDDDCTSRWQSLRALVERTVGHDIGPNPVKYGTCFTVGNMRIGIWLMPNNEMPGMLENFLGFLIPEGDRLLDYANRTLVQLESDSLNNYKLVHRQKALIHTWLAWQEDPGTPYGLAIKKGYFSKDLDAASRFIAWLDCVFL